MNETATIRAFIAIHLPEAAHAELAQVCDVLAGQVPPRSARWVEPHLLHLTLRFLGDTAVSQMPALAVALDEVAAQHAPFTLSLSELGSFPNRQRPRVIWAGLAGDLTAVHALQADIEQMARRLGWEAEEKPFRAHVTLARIKDGRLFQGISWGSQINALPVPVMAVHLMQSQLRPSGPVYTTRHSSALRGR